MTSAPVLAALLRRRAFFAITALVCFAAVVALTIALPRQYDATATLAVAEDATGQDAIPLDTNVGELLSRTYTTLVAQPGVADAVRGQLHPPLSRKELFSRMTFTPVERTQLLQITARAESPTEATTIANTYARTFVSRVAGGLSDKSSTSKVSIAEPAVAPTDAASPNVPLYVGFGLALALLLGAGAALLRDRLDDRLHVGPDDLTVLDHPILVRVPEFDVRSLEDPVASDAFRLLRANIDFSAPTTPRTVGITSAAPLDGKSTVASQLAVAAAASGERVVLVEADLRRPGIRNTAIAEGMDPSARGLTNYLAGVETLGGVLTSHPTVDGLYLIWPGPATPNPTTMLGSARFDELLAELREHFDRVIVDTSPVSVGADASIVLSRLDGAVFVVGAQRTSRSGVQNGIAQLETSRASLLGIVVNRDERQGAHGYGYYYRPETPDSEQGKAASRRRLLR